MNEFNPYSAPKSDIEDFELPPGIWRDEKHAILTYTLGSMPPYCIKCGESIEQIKNTLKIRKNKNRLCFLLFFSQLTTALVLSDFFRPIEKKLEIITNFPVIPAIGFISLGFYLLFFSLIFLLPFIERKIKFKYELCKKHEVIFNIKKGVLFIIAIVYCSPCIFLIISRFQKFITSIDGILFVGTPLVCGLYVLYNVKMIVSGIAINTYEKYSAKISGCNNGFLEKLPKVDKTDIA